MLGLYLSGVLVYGVLALSLPCRWARRRQRCRAGCSRLRPFRGIRCSACRSGRDSAGHRRPARAAARRVVAGLQPACASPCAKRSATTASAPALRQRPARSPPGPLARPAPPPGQFTIRNTFRRKGRVALTQIALIMAGVVFIMVMSSAASFTYTIKFLTDYAGPESVGSISSSRIASMKFTSIIAAQPNVDQIEMQLFQSSTAFTSKEAEKGEDIFVNAFRPESTLIHLPITSGRWLLPADDHAVVLNQDRASKLGVQVGDNLDQPDGDTRSEWTVVGTVFDLSNMQRTVYVPLSVYQPRWA